MRQLKAIILAAGEGSRMKSKKPKVLHEILNKSMVDYVIETAKGCGAEDVCVVVGHKAEEVKAGIRAEGISFALQAEQKGTGHAVMMAGGAFLFIFYPKMVYKLGGKDKDKLQIFLEKIRNIYIFSIDLVALLSIIAIPIITCIVPITQSAINVFKILIIAKVVTNATSGYATLLVAKKQEMILTLYGIISISIVIVLGVLVGKYNYSVEFIAWSIVVASLSYAYLVLKRGMLFFKQISFGNIVKEMFNKGNSCALTCVTISIILNDNFIVPVMSIIIYIYLNRKQLSLTYRMILSILQDRNNLNF